MKTRNRKELRREIDELRTRLEETEETLRAIRTGAVDALIVDGKKGEQVYTLQGADHSYRVLMETMNEGAATLTGDGTILYGNGRLASLLKKSLHDLTGAFLPQFVAPAASRTFAKLLKQGRKGRRSGEIALQCADGTSVPVQISLSPVDMGGTKVVGLVATDLTDLKQAEEALRLANDVLEERVRERTTKLRRANAALRTEISERRKAEEALRRSEATLAEAQRIANVGSWEWDVQSGVILWSDQMFRIFGEERGSFVPTYDGFLALVHPDDRQRTADGIRDSLARGARHAVEYRVLTRQGATRVVLAQAEVMLEREGRSLRVVGTAMDITEHKKREEELHRLNRTLKAHSHSDQAMMFAVDEQKYMEEVCKIVAEDCGHAMERISGHRAADVVGRAIASFFPTMLSADKRREASEQLRELTQGKPVVLTPLSLRSKDGREVSVVPSAAFIRNSEGRPHSIVLTLRDITQLKKTEDELRQANNYNRSLIEASLDPLVTIGPDGKITDVNAATEAATGCSRKELIGTDFSDYFTDPEKARAGYREVFREGVVRDYPLEIRHRDGRILSVLYNASVYRCEGGAVVGVFAAARDITQRLQIEDERKRLADRVIEIQEEERKNISSMLHDHMGQLLTLARLDLERLRPKDERSKRVVRDVLDWLSEVIATVRNVAVSLRPPLLDTMRVETALEPLINDFTKGSKIKFNIKHQAPLPELDADKKICLYRVLQEALTNSVKHSGASQVNVVLGARSRSIWIEVTDNGKGFNVDARDGGKGIGLVNMRERVRQCGGTFNVSSVVGQGSVVRAVIPLAGKPE